MRLKVVGVGALFFVLGCSCGGPNPDDIWWDSGWRWDTADRWDSWDSSWVGETGDTQGTTDHDGDGYSDDDCDDWEADVHPGARDTPADGVDQDCDGLDALAWQAVAVGGDVICGLIDGDVLCDGLDAVEGEYTDLWVASTGKTVCAASAEGLSCWGDDLEGVVAEAPALVPADLVLGAWHGCGLDQGQVSCWGSDLHGQRIEGDSFLRIASGPHAICAATEDALVCAGADFNGQSSPPEGVFDHHDVSGTQGCGLQAESNELVCWGDVQGFLPEFDTHQDQVAVGNTFGCALASQGLLTCWGDIAAPPSWTWTELHAGDTVACALASDGLRMCW